MCQSAGKIYGIVVRSELCDNYRPAALLGILDRIGGLGLELVSVQSLPEAPNDAVSLAPTTKRC